MLPGRAAPGRPPMAAHLAGPPGHATDSVDSGSCSASAHWPSLALVYGGDALWRAWACSGADSAEGLEAKPCRLLTFLSIATKNKVLILSPATAPKMLVGIY